MHEWALAESVVKAAQRHAEAEGMTRIRRVEVEIGSLQQIEPDVFRFALNEVLAGLDGPANGAEFVLEMIPARFRCRVCDAEWTFADRAADLSEAAAESIHFLPELARTHLRCPSCGSRDYAAVQGRGVTIRSIVGEVPR